MNPPPAPVFSERLHLLLAGRSKSPWGKGLGLAGGTVVAMFKGNGSPPTHEGLVRISRAEHVSLRWLLTGEGMRHPVTYYCDDEYSAGWLQGQLGSPAWKILLLDDGDRRGLVLHQPRTVEDSKGPYDYRQVQYIAGHIGPRAMALLRSCSPRIEQLALAPLDMAMFCEGMKGNYAIFGDDETPGTTHAAKPMTPADAKTMAVAETKARYKSEENALVDGWRQLSDTERESLKTVIGPLLDQAIRRNRD